MRSFKNFLEENKGPCWSGYRQVGTKMKNGREVPNCVPVNEHVNCGTPDCCGECNEAKLSEGYNDSIHRKYISDTVHGYVSKDDPKHEKIVDHLHKAKNFGSKTVDSLSDHAGISIGAANAITKEVASNLKANFGSPSKPQTQAQRVDRYLKQKWVKPR